MLAARRPAPLLAALALAAPLSASSRALHFPLEPFEMALAADAIVEGTIVRFDLPRVRDGFSEHTFSIRVDELVAGHVGAGEVVVRQFVELSCAARYAPYEIGQRAIFHLAWPRDPWGNRWPGPLRVMSGGNEGEWPLDGDVAVAPRLAGGVAWGEGAERGQRLVRGHEVEGVFLPEADVVAAIRSLRQLYRWEPPVPDGWDRFPCRHLRRIGSEAELEAFRDSSPTAARYLADIEECLLGLWEEGQRRAR